ncbi:KH domain-containing protein [Thermoactinomyces sp. CICC 10523]|uniref:KH domain-containing protein n=1 Tax=Thermoactinomyces sp. CICC 10523 TaxID=2767428 RepID=UPI0018DE8378|nr:KH domain-containing protein [Thermoactinomyces sp. CICC 10523]MBH8598162.1 KH domain-containing protein [Thermoactinomyces sp. CICC 10523]
MKELIEYMVTALVDNPKQVNVSERTTEDGIVYELSVAKEDLGKVIGRQGRVIRAIRTVVRATAWKEKQRVWVKIV